MKHKQEVFIEVVERIFPGIQGMLLNGIKLTFCFLLQSVTAWRLCVCGFPQHQGSVVVCLGDLGRPRPLWDT